MLKKLPELLAPAGNPSCALAAFDAGADAIYCGLKQFNARERTENFSDEEMDKIIAYAHKNGKKVYVTLNTLIKESELPALGETLALLEELAPDALIVQDAGVLYAAKKFFPGLTIHASTQMGLHNSAGLEFAAQHDIKRVILERQATLVELERMMKHCPPGVETEMFIHGALCCCISGTCLLSSWLGGWSGNRGKCKQPCRRRYHADEGNGFFLSAQDLCMLDALPRIIKSGVSSLKIEGRLRRNDYVTHTVRAYRMALDAAAVSDEAFRAILPEAKEELAKSCGRKWSGGFYTPESARDLIKFDALGASGLLSGKVTNVSSGGFTFSASKRIHLGDLIRVQPRSGDEGPAISVTRMSRGNESVRTVRPGETVFIHTDKAVTPGSLVYKTGESELDYSKRLAALTPQKERLALQIEIDRKHIGIQCGTLSWKKDLELGEAARHPLTSDRLCEEFKTANYDTLSVSSVTADVTGNLFLPASVLKSIRLEFKEFLLANYTNDLSSSALYRKHLEEYQQAIREIPVANKKAVAEHAVILPRKHPHPPGNDWKIIREIKDAPSPHEELLLPFFIPETELQNVKQAIAEFVKKGGKTVRITSLHHLTMLKDFPDLHLKTCMPLPVCNSLAVRLLKEYGIEKVQLWLELEKKELQSLAEMSCLPAELYRYGRPVLLATRARIPAKGKLTDARGMVFQLEKDGMLTSLRSDKVFSIPSVRDCAGELWDLRAARYGEKDAAPFNFEYELR